MKVLVILLLLGIVGSLFSGLFYIYKDRGTGVRTVRALTLRIGLSISLFLLLLIGFRLGFIPGYTQ
ncbi:MAG: twin transmembrane helix small protein [Azonexus sp.]